MTLEGYALYNHDSGIEADLTKEVRENLMTERCQREVFEWKVLTTVLLQMGANRARVGDTSELRGDAEDGMDELTLS